MPGFYRRPPPDLPTAAAECLLRCCSGQAERPTDPGQGPTRRASAAVGGGRERPAGLAHLRRAKLGDPLGQMRREVGSALTIVLCDQSHVGFGNLDQIQHRPRRLGFGDAVTVMKEGGKWKVSTLAGVPLS
jgi:hypothetical protein